MKALKSGATPTIWRSALTWSVVATGLALGLMFGVRQVYQVRTLPERIEEFLLQFVGLNLFEQGIDQFGALAKDFALYGIYVVMALILMALGALALRRGMAAAIGTAAALWLFAMIVIMPLTGAGFFATALPQDVLLTNVVYLAMTLTYGTVLLLAVALSANRAPRSATTAPARAATRRVFLGGVVGSGVAYAATIWLGRTAGTVDSSLPLANVSTLNLPTPAPTEAPTAAVSAAPTAVPTTAPVVAASPTAGVAVAGVSPTAVSGSPTAAAAVPTTAATAAPAASTATAVPATSPTAAPTAIAKIVIPPRPPPQQIVQRDQNGSLTASTRAAGQLASQYTPANGFYITTKNAGGDPVLDPDKWRMVIDGLVNNPVQIDLPILYQLPAIQIVKTLECISNWVNQCEAVPFGCGLIGNASWKGVRLSDVIALAGGLKPGVVSIVTYSTDEFTSSIPPDPTLLSETLLVYEMNGNVLPLEHGYPARLLVPGRYGMKSPKWVIHIQARNDVYTDWYGRLGWNKDAFVQTMTRIDQPANGAALTAGPQPIAGIAYAGLRGVSKVEFSIDGGKSWNAAKFLEDPPGKDTWVRWQGSFMMPASGQLNLAARCVDGAGKPQNTTYTITQPDGGTGLDSITVKSA
jgi:DMSO/TMAO reductase YedYZ molybdopterin-dependent catalytic subunit